MSLFPQRIRPAIDTEIDAARSAEARGEFYTAFRHLERAHVLGQRSTREHVRVHGLMLRFALRNQKPAEAFGQALRIVGAALFTAIGLVPRGNTGGADVSATRRMTVPADLQAAIDLARS